MFEWKRKQLENEQVKFFGGTEKKFISCYAKQFKPRIKIKPIKDSIRIDFNPRYATCSAHQALYRQQHALSMANLQAQGAGNLALVGGLGAAGMCAAGSVIGIGGNRAAWDAFGNKSPYL